MQPPKSFRLAPFVFVGHASVSPISMVCRSYNDLSSELFNDVRSTQGLFVRSKPRGCREIALARNTHVKDGRTTFLLGRGVVIICRECANVKTSRLRR